MTKTLDVDIERLSVRVHGRTVNVTGKRLQLLLCLARRPDWVRTREQLLKELWGREGATRPLKSVDVVVCRLRRDLGVAGELIESVRSFGYRLRDEDSSRSTGD